MVRGKEKKYMEETEKTMYVTLNTNVRDECIGKIVCLSSSSHWRDSIQL